MGSFDRRTETPGGRTDAGDKEEVPGDTGALHSRADEDGGVWIEYAGGAVNADDLMNLTSASRYMGVSRQYVGALVAGKHRAQNRPLKTITIDGVRYTTSAWIDEFEKATSDKARHRPEKPVGGADLARIMDRIEKMEARANKRGWSLFSDGDGNE